MFNLIQKFRSKEKLNFSQIRQKYRDFFYSMPEHNWIVESFTKVHFDHLIKRLPAKLLLSMMSDHPVIFVRSEDVEEELGQALSHFSHRKNDKYLTNKIVIYPEFQRLLSSSRKSAVAYLAHEVAQLFLEIDASDIDSMKAEIEADKFVSDLGLMLELEDYLLMLDETLEKRVRLTYLTCHHFSKMNM